MFAWSVSFDRYGRETHANCELNRDQVGQTTGLDDREVGRWVESCVRQAAKKRQ